MYSWGMRALPLVIERQSFLYAGRVPFNWMIFVSDSAETAPSGGGHLTQNIASKLLILR
jgi:hypothetical protein